MRHAPALLAVLLFAACDRTPDLELARSEQGLKVCPGPATVPGIDVSEWQGSIDWAQVAGSGVKFAITRINDGHHMDPYFQANWDAIKAVGLVRGAYQFYEPNIDAALQASWVVQAVGVLGPGDLPVMLDVEWTSGTPNAQGIGTWLSQVEAGTGKRPLIYTALGYWNQYFTSEFGDYDLVVANYGSNSLSVLFGNGDGTFSWSKFVAVWSQIALLFNFGKSFEALISKPDTLLVILAFLITPDLVKKIVTMKYGK